MSRRTQNKEVLIMPINKNAIGKGFYENLGQDYQFFYCPPPFDENYYGMHFHPHFEILIVPNVAEHKIELNGKTFITDQPTVSIFAPFSLHMSYFHPGSQLERYIFYFGKTLQQGFPDVFKAFLPYNDCTFTQFLLTPEALEELRPLLDQAKVTRQSKMDSKFTFLMIFNTVLKFADRCQLKKTSNHLGEVNAIIQYMCEHHHEKLTTEQVAKHFFISRSKLNKMFQNCMQMSFHELLSNIRLNNALFLLKKKNANIQEIAQELGFESAASFYTFFKKWKGISPRQYNSQYR